MDLTKLTLEEFMCTGRSSMADDRPGTFEHDQARLQPLTGPLVRKLNDQYALHQLNTGRDGDVGILYEGELAIPMVLEGSRYRTLPTSRSHTAAGKRTFEKAWKIAHGLEPNPWP
jgi:hypothetical protein